MGKSPDKVNPQRVRQRFSKEFKLAAVAMLKQGQKPATQIALEHGLPLPRMEDDMGYSHV